MAPTAALLQENFKTARSGCRQAANAFVNKLYELNHLSSSQVKRPPHARNTGEGAASVSPRIYFGKISERAKRALERRLHPHTTLSAYELAYTLRIGSFVMCVRGTDDIAASYRAKFILHISMVQQ
jgi:hypothetical protein